MKITLIIISILVFNYEIFSQGNPTCPGATVIGTTDVEAQAIDGSPGRRIYEWPDNTISATWTIGYNDWPQFPNRGTGYNFFNGLTWQPIPFSRLESLRTGYPNIIRGDINEELIFSHGSIDMVHMQRPNHGTGLWTEYDLFPFHLLWLRVTHGGPTGQTLHLIGNENFPGGFQDYPLRYWRSDDNGLSWSIQNASIPQLDSTVTRMIAPSKNIACRNQVVAMVTGGYTDNLILTKSTDNGNTWINTIINQFPIPLYDEWTMMTDINNDNIADTIMSTDRSATLIIDQNNMVHVWAGRTRIIDPDTNSLSGYFTDQDGLLYWNETMGSNTILSNVIATLEDIDNNGFINLPIDSNPENCGATSMPTSGINNQGHLFVAYSGGIEDTLNPFPPLERRRNVYIMKSIDNGQTWTIPFRICPEEFVDQMFPSMAELVHNDPKILFIRDTSSTSIPQPHHYKVVYMAPDISTAINEFQVEPITFSAWQTASQNSIQCKISNVNNTNELYIKVHDLSGRVLYNYDLSSNSSKDEFRINTPSLKTGIYFVSLTRNSVNHTVKIFYQEQ